MQNRLHNPLFARIMPAIAGICYLVVSLVLPFQHHHTLLEEANAAPQVAAPSRASAPASAPSQAVEHERIQCAEASQCLSCEWESLTVSPALTATVLTFASLDSEEGVASPVSALRFYHPRAASRAPPVA